MADSPNAPATKRPMTPDEFRKAYEVQRPTVAPVADRLVPADVVRCHECVSWQPLGGKSANVGQCHFSRTLGAPLYTTDLGCCSKGVRME